MLFWVQNTLFTKYGKKKNLWLFAMTNQLNCSLSMNNATVKYGQTIKFNLVYHWK